MPATAVSASPVRDREDRSFISLLIKKIQKIFGITGNNPGGAPQGPGFEEQHRALLDDPQLRDGLKLLWFATGKDDFLIETSRNTVATLKKYGFNPVYEESSGGHTWINWRNYLNQFAPQLFP